MTPFRLVADYDLLRLATYQQLGACGERISIESAGKSTFLRFDDVGYFNTVYGYDEDLIDHLDVVEAFFRNSPHGCRLVTPTLSSTSLLARACAARGWVYDQEYAWLTADPLPSPSAPSPRFEVRIPRTEEHELFFRTYLLAFDAEHDRIPAAIENMRHLFSNPRLHFLFACEHNRPAGVAILLQSGHSALLCAGAMLPGHRGGGGHEALLSARIQLARSLGCTDIHSWASLGGHSHANIEQARLRTVRTTLTLRLPPNRLASQ